MKKVIRLQDVLANPFKKGDVVSIPSNTNCLQTVEDTGAIFETVTQGSYEVEIEDSGGGTKVSRPGLTVELGNIPYIGFFDENMKYVIVFVDAKVYEANNLPLQYVG